MVNIASLGNVQKPWLKSWWTTVLEEISQAEIYTYLFNAAAWFVSL